MTRNIINDSVRRDLGEYKNSEFQSFSGTDIKAVMYLPLITTNYLNGKDKTKVKVFADLQTLTVSSTRSISPVRVFGRSNPIAFTKGAITYAGTMVFATINRDAFSDVYDTDIAESYLNTSTSDSVHQLPPFSIVITASNETGAAGIQIIHGITITNYGTTYSVDDLYTETSFTYIATDVSPLAGPRDFSSALASEVGRYGKNLTTLVGESMDKAYHMYTNGLFKRNGLNWKGKGRTYADLTDKEARQIYGLK